jgi:hypothetical protein
MQPKNFPRRHTGVGGVSYGFKAILGIDLLKFQRKVLFPVSPDTGLVFGSVRHMWFPLSARSQSGLGAETMNILLNGETQ